MSYKSSGDPPNPIIHSETKSPRPDQIRPPQPPWTLINIINIGSSSRTYLTHLVLLIHSFRPKYRYWISKIEAPKSNHRLMLTSCILLPQTDWNSIPDFDLLVFSKISNENQTTRLKSGKSGWSSVLLHYIYMCINLWFLSQRILYEKKTRHTFAIENCGFIKFPINASWKSRTGNGKRAIL